MTITVNAKLFRAVSLCVSTEETRYYLNGVYIHKHAKEGAVLVATDGNRMMIAHDVNGIVEGEPKIIRLDKTALTAAKGKRNESAERTIQVDDDGTAKILAGDEIAHIALRTIVDGTFPDYGRVVPSGEMEGGALFTFNGKYLADFGEISRELTGDDSRQVTIENNGGGPARVRFPGIDFAFGLLMPIRHKGETGVPQFYAAAA